MRRFLPAWGLILATAPPAHGQPVLHEYVPEVDSDELEALASHGPSGEPSVVVYDGEVFPAPEGGARRMDEHAMGADGAGADFRPDRLTELEDTLGYYAVFTPSVAPFKRVTALDAVRLDRDGHTPVLAVHDDRRRALRVEGEGVPPPDGRPRDRFWGNVVLDFRKGRRVPLPSVSPESRILRVRTEPQVDLRFERNGAGAYFAVAAGEVPREPVRLIFLTDAPRPYFNAALPEVAVDVLAHEVPPVPASVRERASAFAAELGIRRGAALPEALSTLVEHFRAFEESSVPPLDQGDIFMDLARAQKGVCRHRTYAFVITAQVLGLPSRFVYNEAHSWAEVKMPGVGWMRVDLGGAARGLETHGAEDRPVYRPPEPDPLPRPAGYAQGYSQLAGDVSGLRDGPGAASASEQGRSPSERGRRGDEPGGEPSGGGSEARAGGMSEPGQAEPSEREERARIPVRLAMDRERYQAYRGRVLHVAGRATDPHDRGVSDLRIEVLLRRHGETLVGVTVTDGDGRFEARFGLPPDLPVGDYELVVRSPGDRRHMAAVAY